MPKEKPMPYDPQLVAPMREELSQLGVQELMTASDVDQWMSRRDEPQLLIVNSVCGCAAGQARPAVALAMQHPSCPSQVATVFAGQDLEATARARSYFSEFPPSSPSMVMFKNGEIVHFLPRHRIESRDAQTIAQELIEAFQKHCVSA
jgi:putative YphP/YqiW family bacilliredoxin